MEWGCFLGDFELVLFRGLMCCGMIEIVFIGGWI